MTDQPKWTPGPWRADGATYNRVVWSDADNRVCFMAHSNGLDGIRDIATSNLVTAAPDLYAALEACVVSLERANTEEGVCCCGDSMDRHSDPMHCGHSPVDMGDYYAGQALKAARAALAKARGETK